MLNIDDYNKEQVITTILSVFGYEDIDLPEIILITKVNCKAYKKNQTQYDVTNNVIYFYNEQGVGEHENLMRLVHECYHVIQKHRNQELMYSEEHKQKYSNCHMYMFYKFYPFECEATGYAQAFVYFYLKTVHYLKNTNMQLEIDIYSKPDSVQIDDVDSKEDYEEISEKLLNSYNVAIDFFNKSFFSNNDVIALYRKNVSDSEKVEEFAWKVSALDKNCSVYKMKELCEIIGK